MIESPPRDGVRLAGESDEMKNFVRTGAFAGVLFSATLAHAGEWIQKSPTGPRPSERSAPAVAAIGTKIYLFGGVMDDFTTGIDTFYNDMFRYDSVANSWSTITPAGAVPHERAFAAASDHKGLGRMYIFGGAHYGPFFSDLIAFDDLWYYRPSTNSWTQVTATNAGPSGRAGASMWIDLNDDTIYIFGGVDQFFGTHNDLWSYDINCNTWTLLIADGAPGSPPPRHVAMGTAHPKHGKATIYGGESIDEFFNFGLLGDTWQYDLSSNSWNDVTPAPAHDISPPRNYAAAGLIGNFLVLQGGDIPGGEDGCGSPFPQNVTDEVWRFHLNQHKWVRQFPSGDPLVRIKRTGSAVIGDVLYVFSGWDFQCPGGVGPGQVWNLETWAYDN
jgi:hypothetical protein